MKPRPVLRYHGGKWMLAPWLISFFPPHRIYCEPFGGAASVLMAKPRAFAEVYNDLDDEVVTVFRVLREPELAERLKALLELTPWSRTEFYAAYDEAPGDPVEQARRTIVRSFMAFGTTSRRKNRTGFRARAYRQNQTGAQDWTNYPNSIALFVERLRGVCIEAKSAFEIIPQQDTPETLFYVDPPYVRSTRPSQRWDSRNDRAYAHELTDDDHRRLAELLHSVQGMVLVSGYACDLYDTELYADWTRFERPHHADGAKDRIEVIWLNPRCEEGRQSITHQTEAFAL